MTSQIPNGQADQLGGEEEFGQGVDAGVGQPSGGGRRNGPAHDHGHGHKPAHGHGQGHGQDTWDGAAYLARPGVKETAQISYDSIVHALKGVGMTEEEMKHWAVLEIGSGPGAVTAHLLRAFSIVHAIDTSPSMLLSLSSNLPYPPHSTLTHSLHSLSPSSPTDFLSALFSPTIQHPERRLTPPCAEFDVAVANLVAHHVDDLEGWMAGLVGMLRVGGWAVITEFGREEGGRDVAGEVRNEQSLERAAELEARRKDDGTVDLKTLPSGSVNAPGHHHPSFTPSQLSALLQRHGLVDVHAEIRGTLPVWPDRAHPPCLVVRGRKAGP